MKSILLLAFFFFSFLTKGQTILIDYSQLPWTDIAPDSSMRCLLYSGGTTAQMSDSLKIDLTNDNQVDFSINWYSNGGLSGRGDRIMAKGLNGASITRGDSTGYGGIVMTHNFKINDTVPSSNQFTNTNLYIHYNSWMGGPNYSSTHYSLFNATDSIIHVCVKAANTLYFVQIRVIQGSPFSQLYVIGYYTMAPVGISFLEEISRSFIFSEGYFSYTFYKEQDACFSITDITGREIQRLQTKHFNVGETTTIKLPSEPGIYIMNYIQSDQRKSIKFIVQ